MINRWFTSTCAISVYYHESCEIDSWHLSVLSTALCDKVYQVRYSPGTPVSSYTNKIDLHNIAEILLKVMLETINPTYIYCWELY
jgi:hypothetical protein